MHQKIPNILQGRVAREDVAIAAGWEWRGKEKRGLSIEGEVERWEEGWWQWKEVGGKAMWRKFVRRKAVPEAEVQNVWKVVENALKQVERWEDYFVMREMVEGVVFNLQHLGIKEKGEGRVRGKRPFREVRERFATQQSLVDFVQKLYVEDVIEKLMV